VSEFCVVVASGARARFFTLEPIDVPEFESGPRLVERGEIFNEEKSIPGLEKYSGPKAGSHRGSSGGPAHDYEDHRLKHELEADRRFARQILAKTRQITKDYKPRHLVVAAPARILGSLTNDLKNLGKPGLSTHKVAKDLTKFSPEQIHKHLHEKGILPTRKGPGNYA